MNDTTMRLLVIGEIRTAYASLADCPPHGQRERTSVVEILPEYEGALYRIEEASHLYLMYWLDRADRNVLRRTTPHDGENRGVFAIRSPHRPNPIGLSVVKLFERRGAALTVSGLDCLDGTVLVDIKPYVPAHDAIPEATLGWYNV